MNKIIKILIIIVFNLSIISKVNSEDLNQKKLDNLNKIKYLNKSLEEFRVNIKKIEKDPLSVKFIYAFKYSYYISKPPEPEKTIDLLKDIDNKSNHPLINEINMLLADSYMDLALKESKLGNYQKTKNSLLKAKKIISFISPKYTPPRKEGEPEDISLSPENIKKWQIASPEKVKDLKKNIDELIIGVFGTIAEGKIYNNKGKKDYKGGINELEALNKLYPNTEIYYTHIGYALFFNKQVELGLKLMKKGVELFPKSGQMYYQFACISSLNKDKENAIYNLKKSIELDKKFLDYAKQEEDLKFIREDKIFKSLVK